MISFKRHIFVTTCCAILMAPATTFANGTAALDSILGVTVGMTVEDARQILSPLGEAAGRDTRSGGRKEGYLLRDDPAFSWVAFKAGHAGTLKWVSANLRVGAEIPFSELGSLAQADSANEYQVIWNVPRAGSGYRLVAKGEDGKASVIYLLALE